MDWLEKVGMKVLYNDKSLSHQKNGFHENIQFLYEFHWLYKVSRSPTYPTHHLRKLMNASRFRIDINLKK